MTNQHPITPPPELIKDWHDEWDESDQIVHSAYTHIALRAAQWGADQELEACCEWLEDELVEEDRDFRETLTAVLRAARRPKPPSLAEEALKALNSVSVDATEDAATRIRRALERLQELEGGK